MTYEQAMVRLAALGPEMRSVQVNGATVARKFSMDHITALLRELGDPQHRFRSVLIAGTNGKGSTAATLASIANAAGIATGLYTSPHLERLNERIKTTQQGTLADIPDAAFATCFARVDAAATALVQQGILPHPPSYFEVVTAVAFCWFAETAVQLAVLEVGLGGRLDATNSVEPLVSVVTDIGMDHMEYLGNTLREIATEKAGILRQDGVLVTLSQHPEANAAIGNLAMSLNVRGVDAARCLPPRDRVQGTEKREQEAGEKEREAGEKEQEAAEKEQEAGSAPPENFAISTEAKRSGETRSGIATAPPTTVDNLLTRNRYPLSIEGQVLQVDSPLFGQHQQRNIALAIATAIELRTNHEFAIPNVAIEQGIRDTRWPGRLEWFDRGQGHAPLLLDVAHNPAGAWTLRAALAQLPESMPRTLIFSCLKDKQLSELAQVLLPLFDASSGDPDRARDHVIVAPIASSRAMPLEDLLAAAAKLDVPAEQAVTLKDALKLASEVTPENGIIVATGSVFLVGEVRFLLG